MAGLQDALEDVASRLETLKAALSGSQEGGPCQGGQLAAIKRMQQELEALLQAQAQGGAQDATDARFQGAAAAGQHRQHQQQPAEPAPRCQASQPASVAAKATGPPATPLDQRRAPDTCPANVPRSAAPTPRGGLPATTPLAAEVLASLNGLGESGSLEPASTAVPAPLDGEDGAAAATLSGFMGAAGSGVGSGSGGLELLPSAAGSSHLQHPLLLQSAAAPAPALASLLQDAALMPPQPLSHAAAMAAAAAAAAAAGPALPVPRRLSHTAPGLLGGASLQREQRPCNCKRSMCLKMYCECFAAGGFCAPSCSCLNCSNTPAEMGAVQAAREVVLAKNPKAFEVKVTATEGHKRGCRCKRSKCLKKYCECFHAGARCNPDVCQCEDCRNTEGDAMLMPLLVSRPVEQAQAWADTSADVLAMFQQQQPLPLLPLPLAAAAAGSDGAESSGSDGTGASAGCAGRGGAGRRAQAQAQQLPLPAALAGGSAPFHFGLPPLPEAMPPSNPAAAAMLGSFPAASMFGVPALPTFDQAAAAAFLLNPVAAAAAATIAAAATMAEQQQQQMEESMADAVSCPAARADLLQPSGHCAAAVAMAATPSGDQKMGSALTSHLSDMAGAADVDMHDTATSPAPHLTMASLAARRTLAAAMPPTLTGGAAGAGGLPGRPPLPIGRMRSRAVSGDSQLSQGSADENGGDSSNTAASQRGKRPRRAASGGVLGAVAAEAAEWGCELVSPPLKRATSMPLVHVGMVHVGMELGARGHGAAAGKPTGRGAKVSDRVALLKRALAGDSLAVQLKLAAAAGAEPEDPAGQRQLLETSHCTPTPEDDAVSALFELSASVC